MSEPLPPQLDINPPLLNSANPWATTLEQLRELYACASTGAVTTRTSLVGGFDHQEAVHRYAFFDPSTHANLKDSGTTNSNDGAIAASLNTLGYSPITLGTYLEFIKTIAQEFPESRKPFIISVTGTPDEVAQCYASICAAGRNLSLPLAMEINLSCPNIPNAPPPAYDGAALARYLETVSPGAAPPEVAIGIKTPPYTHAGDFKTLVSALAASSGGSPARKVISFVTATNTLGSCLVLEPAGDGGFAPRLPGAGIGGMAGPPLHPLALGNVATIGKLLAANESTRHIRIIGVGGVGDADGYKRMRSVGAHAVAIGTALGQKGVQIFGEIEKGLSGNW